MSEHDTYQALRRNERTRSVNAVLIVLGMVGFSVIAIVVGCLLCRV